MSRETFIHDMRRMRREFARLIEADPDSFDKCVRLYMARGAASFPPIKSTGGRLPVPDSSLAFLLADYRIAQENGVTQESFCEEKAEQGISSGDRYSGVYWYSPDAIRKKLQDARKKERDDAEFAGEVEFREFALKALRGE